jgi:phosphopantothenoylcysteine decarboxylase/phosphopantothenate--cysteine ligase
VAACSDVIGPEDGPLTGGDVGPGRMSEPERIHAFATALLSPRDDLAGLNVLVTAGGTREPIDPVRYIGNRSSGRQGVAVALAAAERGARVTLVAAHADADVLAQARTHPRVEIAHAPTAAELAAEVRARAGAADVVVMAAAVADYRVSEASDRKLAKEDAGDELTLRLVETEDILAALARNRHEGQTIVGFAAETETDAAALLERARRKRRRKGVDLLAVNEVGWQKGFESTANTLMLIGASDEVVATVSGSKREVADALWDAVLAQR